jgi:hypothetical protein
LPVRDKELAEGRYSYKVQADGYASSTGHFWVVKHKSVNVDIALQDKSRTDAILRSAFIPGWGQFYEEKKTTGVLFMLAYAGAIGAHVYARSDHSKKMDEFDAVARMYETAHTEDMSLGDYQRLQNDYESKLDAANSSADFQNLTLAALVGVWTFNMIDSMILYPKRQRGGFFMSERSFKLYPEIKKDRLDVVLKFAF